MRCAGCPYCTAKLEAREAKRRGVSVERLRAEAQERAEAWRKVEGWEETEREVGLA